jgi:hypothetical protein
MTPAFQNSKRISKPRAEPAARGPSLPPSPRCPQFPKDAPADLFGGHCGTPTSEKRDSETYEITGLDIGCERAMFQKFEMICLTRLVACAAIGLALPRSDLPDELSNFKNRRFSKLKKKRFEWRNGQ